MCVTLLKKNNTRQNTKKLFIFKLLLIINFYVNFLRFLYYKHSEIKSIFKNYNKNISNRCS